MKLFECPHCRGRLYFENAQCLTCGSLVLYDPDRVEFVMSGQGHRACSNATECGCNWAARPEALSCRACELNHTIPDLSITGNHERWTRVEAAKRRAVYSLLAFGLPVGPKVDAGDEIGLAFDFLGDPMFGNQPTGEKVLTGHDNGVVTLNLAEAEPAEREKMRSEMGEAYRTLLGHFRHELGHYYWDRLIRDDPARRERFAAIFGDATVDYEQALQRHYAQGAPPDWQSNYLSAYAASHPWEDWAETFAHYLHITDTLEMVDALGIPLTRLETGVEVPQDVGSNLLSGPFDNTLHRWLALSEATNSINRCMGLPDLYPFVISPPAAAKLSFVDELLAHERRQVAAS